VLKNGSLWADIFLARNGANPDPQNSAFDPALVHHVRKRMFLALLFCAIPLTIHAVLTPYLPRIKVRKEKNLLNKDTNEEAGEEAEEVCLAEISFLTVHSTTIQPDIIAPHWHPVFSFFLHSTIMILTNLDRM
jgi:hypothetical protein